MSDTDQPDTPMLRVVTGNPTPEEIAALLGVMASMGSPEVEPAPQTSAWSASARKGRYLPRPSPAAWRLSLRTT